MTAAKVCPGCARPNAADARFCSTCARPLDEVEAFQVPERPSAASPPPTPVVAAPSAPFAQPAPPRRRKPLYRRWWVYALLVVVGLGVWGSTMQGKESTVPSDKNLGAFDVCKQFVKERLRAPATATFRNAFQDDGEVVITNDVATGNYTVQSSVDAENGFGAKIRDNFTCVVSPAGGNNWHLVNLDLTER